VGDAGNTKDKFIKLAEENNLLNNINFLGVQDRCYIKKVHNKSHIYILPSKREALGVSIIEAAASGTTVIASDVGGIPEVIEDGEEGLLVSPLDYDSLYKSINKLVDNPKFRFQITHNAKNKSEKFSYDNVFKNITNEF
jgi:glycosyltransferase involved in cell wall biosynthesis